MNKDKDISRKDIDTKSGFNDIQLNQNGTKTTLKTEISRRIQSYQKSKVVDYLQHDVMVISQSDKSDDLEIAVENALNNTDVNWNLLSFHGRQFLDNKPEIFKFLKPFNIVNAAKKAGIINQARWPDLVWPALILLVCFILCVTLLVFSGGNIKEDSFFNQAVEILQSKGFLISWCISGLTGLLVYRCIKRSRLINNAGLLKKIVDCSGSSDLSDKIGSEFFNLLRNEVLQLQMPLAIMISGNEYLDSFTRKILTEVLTIDRSQNSGLIFWVIIDLEETGTENELVAYVKKNSNKNGFSCNIYRFECFL